MAGKDEYYQESFYDDIPIPPRKTPLPKKKKTVKKTFSFRAGGVSVYLQFQSPVDEKARLFRQDAERYAARESEAVYDRDYRVYYTTYRDLSREALEGYFGWRTRLRRGIYGWAPLSFKFLYTYELLSCIGVASPEAGYEALEALKEHYADAALQNYLTVWMRDFAIYYRLGAPYMDRAFAAVRREDALREALLQPEAHSAAQVFGALQAVSTYKMDSAAFMKAEEEKATEAAVRVYAAVCAAEGRAFAESLAGQEQLSASRMFRSAVFFDPHPCPDGVVEVDSIRRYICKNGLWRCESRGDQPLAPSPTVGALLHETDRVLREVFAFPHRLKSAYLKPSLQALVEETVRAYAQELKRAANPPVEVDRSLLSAIRSDADLTMASLLVEEEEESAFIPPLEPEPTPEPVSEASPPDTGLTPEETEFLHLLLTGEDWRGFIARQRQIPSLLADSINEKLLDSIGDTVLESDGNDNYTLIEDYREDVRALLGME